MSDSNFKSAGIAGAYHVDNYIAMMKKMILEGKSRDQIWKEVRHPFTHAAFVQRYNAAMTGFLGRELTEKEREIAVATEAGVKDAARNGNRLFTQVIEPQFDSWYAEAFRQAKADSSAYINDPQLAEFQGKAKQLLSLSQSGSTDAQLASNLMYDLTNIIDKNENASSYIQEQMAQGWLSSLDAFRAIASRNMQLDPRSVSTLRASLSGYEAMVPLQMQHAYPRGFQPS